ncbi:unnamed protein product [Pedinophyceae sp. YPF-701]|nr:unnamed protein product [Pedinophyceae sp. YPF-701]
MSVSLSETGRRGPAPGGYPLNEEEDLRVALASNVAQQIPAELDEVNGEPKAMDLEGNILDAIANRKTQVMQQQMQLQAKTAGDNEEASALGNVLGRKSQRDTMVCPHCGKHAESGGTSDPRATWVRVDGAHTGERPDPAAASTPRAKNVFNYQKVLRLEMETRRLTRDLNKAHASLVESERKWRMERKALVDSFREDLHHKEVSLQQLQKEMRDLPRKMRDAQAQLAESNARAVASENLAAETQRQLVATEREVVKMRAALTKQGERVKELRGRNQHLKTAMGRMSATVGPLRDQQTRLAYLLLCKLRELNETGMSLKDAEQKADEHHKRALASDDMNKMSEEVAGSLVRESAKQQDSIFELRKQLQRAAREAADERQRAARARSDKIQAENALQAVMNSRDLYETKTRDLQQNINSAAEEKQQLRGMVEELSHRVGELENMLAEDDEERNAIKSLIGPFKFEMMACRGMCLTLEEMPDTTSKVREQSKIIRNQRALDLLKDFVQWRIEKSASTWRVERMKHQGASAAISRYGSATSQVLDEIAAAVPALHTPAGASPAPHERGGVTRPNSSMHPRRGALTPEVQAVTSPKVRDTPATSSPGAVAVPALGSVPEDKSAVDAGRGRVPAPRSPHARPTTASPTRARPTTAPAPATTPATGRVPPARPTTAAAPRPRTEARSPTRPPSTFGAGHRLYSSRNQKRDRIAEVIARPGASVRPATAHTARQGLDKDVLRGKSADVWESRPGVAPRQQPWATHVERPPLATQRRAASPHRSAHCYVCAGPTGSPRAATAAAPASPTSPRLRVLQVYGEPAVEGAPTTRGLPREQEAVRPGTGFVSAPGRHDRPGTVGAGIATGDQHVAGNERSAGRLDLAYAFAGGDIEVILERIRPHVGASLEDA